MSATVVETLVEPLDLVDDRTSSRDLASVPMSMADKLLAKPVGVHFDEEEEEELDVKLALIKAKSDQVQPPPSPRTANARVDSQNPLVLISQEVPSIPPQPESLAMKEEKAEEAAPPPENNHAVDESVKEEMPHTEPALESPATASPILEPTAPTKEEVEQSVAEVQAFLYHKVHGNQCSTHAKEIHDFLTNHLSECQRADLLPQVIDRLAQQFQREAGGQEEVSLDEQSSLCLLELMLVPVGRRSPLQDMYTAEEEELLNQLGNNSSRQ